MSSSFIARVYYGDALYSIDLTNKCPASIGSDSSDDINLNAYKLSRHNVRFVNTKSGIKIKGRRLYRRDTKIKPEKRSRVWFSDRISVNKKYVVSTDPEILISIHPKQSDDDKNVIDLSSANSVTFGRSSKNNIIFSNMTTSHDHMKIYKSGGQYRISDADSSNGTYVNGRKITDSELRNGDIINFSIYQLVFRDGKLQAYNVGTDMVLNKSANVAVRKAEEEKTHNDNGGDDDDIWEVSPRERNETINFFDSQNNSSNSE